MNRVERRLLLFTFTKLADMMAKGNVWYVRHYERYFDHVTVAYCVGSAPERVSQGRTDLISLAPPETRVMTLLLMPYRLWRVAREVEATSYFTADMFYSWWTALLLRLLSGARVVLMPVAIPAETLANTGRTITGLPMFIERLMIRLSFAAATTIISGENIVALTTWLRSERLARGKLKILPVTVEEFPPASFFDAVEGVAPRDELRSDPPRLLYVGRLHRDKLAGELVDMMADLKRRGVLARLVLAGDGPERASMERRADELDVASDIEWLGYVPHEQLASIYAGADMFLSTVTGTALREAGLSGLPIVAYAIDWVRDLLRDGETAMLVPPHRPDLLAATVERLLDDAPLRRRIGAAFFAEARSRWSVDALRQGLNEAFGMDTPTAPRPQARSRRPLRGEG